MTALVPRDADLPTPPRIEPCRKRVRAYLDGHLVVDSARPLLVWENPRYPTYWFPEDDVRADLRPAAEGPLRSDVVAGAAGGVIAQGAARRALPETAALGGHVAFDWGSMTEWLEEDEPVYVHARDPYTRVDVLPSSRHVTVSLEGQVLADSVRPTLLFETGHRPRYYLPLSDVATERLEPSDTVSACPYKGTAAYWSVRIGDARYPDLAWTYRTPLPEVQKIAGLVCFYDERVDLTVDP
jgi:uncharacterized protein (DUF427 family)